MSRFAAVIVLALCLALLLPYTGIRGPWKGTTSQAQHSTHAPRNADSNLRAADRSPNLTRPRPGNSRGLNAIEDILSR